MSTYERMDNELAAKDDRIAELERDLASLRHDLSVAQNWVEHHSKHADDLIAVNVALRAALDPERIIAAIQLPGGHYCDPQAVADAIRTYCGAALVGKESAK